MLAEALKRVSQELRRTRSATSAVPAPEPSGGPPAESKSRKAAIERSSSRAAIVTPSKLPTVRADPREVGRVSAVVKSAQARRDAKPR